MNVEEIKELMKAMADNRISQMKLEEGNMKLVLKKKEKIVLAEGNSFKDYDEAEDGISQVVIQEKETHQTGMAAEGNRIFSPLVGTIYLTPGEGMEPFVKVGDQVKAGSTIAIVEAMKLMNDINCDVNGIVTEVLVENGQMVEYGQPLFTVKEV